jgi:CheY-like chemotaxis protein
MEASADTRNSAERRHGDQPLRVLVLDDNPDTVDTLATLLETEGHVVQRSYSGKDALPAARLFRPDVIIVDLAVPGMSGFAVAQAIRHSFTDIRRPLLIAISGIWKDAPDQQIAHQVGFDHYLPKPCDPREVLRLLGEFRTSRLRPRSP